MVVRATIHAADLPAGFSERTVLCRIAFSALRRRVGEPVIHFHGEAAGHTCGAIHNHNRNVDFISAEDVLQVVADHNVPFELKHQQGLSEKVPNGLFRLRAEQIGPLPRLPGLSHGSVHLSLLP